MNKFTEQLIRNSLHYPVQRFSARQGKRIRCGLMQHAYALGGGEGDLPESLGEAVEWLHAGSLVIDDIQDNSLSRRECPTMHRQIGVPLAINAGNWMYFHSLELMASAPLEDSVRSQAIVEMVSAARTCHEGQALDLASSISDVPLQYWSETVRSVSDLKTGTLVGLAMTLGAVAARASSGSVTALRRFGNRVGRALQMRNDLAELTQVDRRDDDLRSRRLTWVWVWAYEELGGDAVDSLRQRLGACGNFSDGRHRSEVRQIASELLNAVQLRGNACIRRLVESEIRLLGEHIVDRRGLHDLRQLLSPIEQTDCATSETIRSSEVASAD